MIIRKYIPANVKTLAGLFRQTVHIINALIILQNSLMPGRLVQSIWPNGINLFCHISLWSSWKTKKSSLLAILIPKTDIWTGCLSIKIISTRELPLCFAVSLKRLLIHKPLLLRPPSRLCPSSCIAVIAF